MAEIYVNRVRDDQYSLIEDVNSTQNRLFIGGRGFDKTTLSNLWFKDFHFQFNDIMRFGGTTVTANGLMFLEKGVAPAFAVGGTVGAGETFNNGDMMGDDTYNHSLDFNNYPAKHMWKTTPQGKLLYNIKASNFYTQVSLGTNPQSTGARYNNPAYWPNIWGYWHSTTDDLTYGTGGSLYTTSTGSNWPCMFVYEDVANQKLYGIHNQATHYTGGATLNLYEAPVGYSITNLFADYNGKTFFIGVDSQGWTYWVSVIDKNFSGDSLPLGHSQYTLRKVNPSSLAVTTVASGIYSGQYTYYLRCYPSNILRTSANRRIFYSSHFAANGTLQPIRFTFDAAQNNVWSNSCIMTYQGANTFNTYSSMVNTTSGAIGGNSHPLGADVRAIDGSWTSNPSSGGSNACPWHYKPHVFTLSGVNYVTFFMYDKSAIFDNGPNRWNIPGRRTAITYTLGAGTGNGAGSDQELTFHSALTFNTVFDMPKNILPLNVGGTLLAMPIQSQLAFYSFNAATGWNLTGTYPIEFRAIGLDSTNRLWGSSLEKGYGVLHAITPTVPVNISLVMASQNYSYTGSNISTSAILNAYDAEGSRIATTINLVIDGNTMLFASNNTRILQINTSSSADTTVALTITGGGINNIVANVNI